MLIHICYLPSILRIIYFCFKTDTLWRLLTTLQELFVYILCVQNFCLAINLNLFLAMTLVVVNLVQDNKRWRKIGAIKINNIIPIVGKIRGGVRLWFIQSYYGIINLAKIPLCYFGNVCFRNLMYTDLKYSIEATKLSKWKPKLQY